MDFKQTKLARLVRYHRQNVFNDDDKAARRHERALRRLKSTPMARAIYAEQAAHADWRASERLLRMWA